MDRNSYIEEIKLQLTGGLLELEIDDITLSKILDMSLREVQRYINFASFVTVPYQKAIDISNLKVSSIINVYRVDGVSVTNAPSDAIYTDPMYASQYRVISSSGNISGLQDYVYNYSSWLTLMQMRNTTSTDMSFIVDKDNQKLYVNASSGTPEKVTIEYIPRYDSVEDITSNYWIDVVSNLAIAHTKIIVGRIRTRFTQSNPLWIMDGETMLEEGKTELQALRDKLQENADLHYPMD